MTIRRLLCLTLAVLTCTISALALEPPALREEIYGLEAVLYCAETGQTLYEKNADVPAPPASVTKLMTALVVLEHEPDLSKTTTVSESAVDIERDSTHIALTPGEQVTLEQMLCATLINSANDAANVLAEAVGGTQKAFAQMMNDRAYELGCTGSHFENAHGLDADGHVMTARDVARIAAALLEDDRFVEISGKLVYTMEPTNKQPEARTWYTKQRMLRADSAFYNRYVIAGKNGYTTKAQHTQCTIARKDGMTLIAVSMGSSDNMYYPWRDMRTLFALGLDNYRLVTLTGEQTAALAGQAGVTGVDPAACAPVPVVVPVEAGVDNLSLSETADPAGIRTIRLTLAGETVDLAPMPFALAPDAELALKTEAEGPSAAPSAADAAPQKLSFDPTRIDWMKVFYGALAVVAACILGFLFLLIRSILRVHRSRKEHAARRRAAAAARARQTPSAEDRFAVGGRDPVAEARALLDGEPEDAEP